jgi:hypothetical protein
MFKKLDKMLFGFSHEIETGGMDLALDGWREMGNLGQNYAFNIFCAAFIDHGCRIYPL